MPPFLSFILIIMASILSAYALPRLESVQVHDDHEIAARDGLPPIPDRPDNVRPDTFHVSMFTSFDQYGFIAGTPAVEAAPVFLFSRTQKNYDPCYPESAVVIGSNPPKPNPGTDTSKGTESVNPGADCTNPGPYNGGE